MVPYVDKSNDSLESNESSLEEESDEIKTKENLGLDLNLIGKPTVPDPILLSPKAKKAKKKLKKILDAKNFVNEALKKEKGALEDRKAKISANIKDYKDQKKCQKNCKG